MAFRRSLCALLVGATFTARGAFAQEEEGSGTIRGLVYDDYFEQVLGGATITVVEADVTVTADDQGNFVIRDLPPGQYTIVISADGYVREVPPRFFLGEGQFYDMGRIELAADFTELEEYVVEDLLQLDTSSEAGLLQLRLESPSLLDSISAELMSAAGASDAASAIKLIPGATVKDGKSAVIRGLPDRYVSSQLNGVRLPTADEDKRAVELDQFPSAVIEDIRVSKTFTPDQQGDASGGAVDIRLRGLPSEFFFEFKSQVGYNSQFTGDDNFLTYDGAGVGFFNDGVKDRREQTVGENWDGAVGVSQGRAPLDHKWSMATGGSYEWDNGVRVGALLNFFYDRDNSFRDDEFDDSYWVTEPGEDPVPELNVRDDVEASALFDIQRSTQSLQFGQLATAGVEWEDHSINLFYLNTTTIDDKAILAEDTRGKSYFFPGYDPTDPTTPGHDDGTVAPWLRLQTLEYTERQTKSLQLTGQHVFSEDGLGRFGRPKLDWTIADSSASLDQPDKRLFSTFWVAENVRGGLLLDSEYRGFKPDANFTLGNLQRIYKTITEDSQQYFVNLELPFQQWGGLDSYLKFGIFSDEVDRKFDTDTFSNFGDNSSYQGDWEDYWSDVWGNEDHPISDGSGEFEAGEVDVDYTGNLDTSATYMMANVPLFEKLTVIGGVRWEDTGIGVVTDGEEDAFYYDPRTGAPIPLRDTDESIRSPSLDQADTLPSLTFIYEPYDFLSFRTAFSRTVARPTFKEITPVIQQEFLGGPIFVGNPEIKLSEVENYDFRVDYRPYQGALISASWFRKDISDPIEYVQRARPFTYTLPVNYPEGTLGGFEFEVRQDLGFWFSKAEGFKIGANATLIDSEVTVDPIERDDLLEEGVDLRTRDMLNAPEHLYNFFLTYDIPASGTQIGLFYTITGDTLLEGAGTSDGNFIPSVYAKEFDSLNFSLSQPIGEHLSLKFQAKNLTNPEIDTVYRSDTISSDVTKTRFTTGIDYSIALTLRVTF